jgi:hypothetical protein
MDSTVPSTLSRPPVRAPVQDRELDWAE